MSLSFPLNPQVGQIYVAPNGIIYTFDGVKWAGNASSSYQTTPFIITDTTPAVSSTSGSLVAYGGAGIVGNLYVGGKIYQSGVQVGTGGVSSIIAGTGITINQSTGDVTINSQGIGPNGTTSTFVISNTTNSFNTQTGALQTTGGAAVAQDVWVGGTVYVGSAANALTSATVQTLIAMSTYNFAGSGGSTNTVFITGGVESTSTTSGDLVVVGGIGLGKNITSGGKVSGNTGSFNTLLVNGVNITGSGVTNRTTASITVSSITSGSSVTATMIGYIGYALYNVTVSTATWVTLYSSTATMTSDYSRAITTDPTPGSGVIAEAITTQSGTTLFTPAIIGFSSEAVPNTNIPVKIYNNSTSTVNITVTLTLLKMEG